MVGRKDGSKVGSGIGGNGDDELQKTPKNTPKSSRLLGLQRTTKQEAICFVSKNSNLVGINATGSIKIAPKKL